MILMTEQEVWNLAFGGAKTTATALRVFAVLALVGGVLSIFFAVVPLFVVVSGTVVSSQDTVLGIYSGLTALLAGALLNALAWIVDLLRGILAGVWHVDYEEEEEDDDGL